MTQKNLQSYSVKPGNIIMSNSEINIQVPSQFDPQSKTCLFKSIEVFLEKQL